MKRRDFIKSASAMIIVPKFTDWYIGKPVPIINPCEMIDSRYEVLASLPKTTDAYLMHYMDDDVMATFYKGGYVVACPTATGDIVTVDIGFKEAEFTTYFLEGGVRSTKRVKLPEGFEV